MESRREREQASRGPALGERTSGVLLHPTSLPGRHGSGDLGEEARRFADFLAAAGQRWWQMLPVGPPGYGDSPYSAESAFAGSPALVSLDALAREGLLTPEDVAVAAPFPEDHVDFAAVRPYREERLGRAFERARHDRAERAALAAFREEHRAWLDDFALFQALKRAHGGVAWTEWPAPLRDRDPRALAEARLRLAEPIERISFEQQRFDRQWRALREAAAARGVGLIGDVPIFVAHDSADVWQHRELFRLDAEGRPEVVAGVPPDYFSPTGQRWGNPLYRWDALRTTGYAWWIERLRSALGRFDAVRLDHFIGFVRYWAIPASCPTAVEGEWLPGPGAELFEAVRDALGQAPFIAEDLGAVTPEVLALRDRFGFPGLKILQFAFGDDPSAPSFVPEVYPRASVVYTGTHDNDTTWGWFHEEGGAESTRSAEQTERERRAAMRYLGTDGREIHWDLIRAALESKADTAIAPAQDLLGLGSEARMNRPGTAAGNWGFRLRAGALDERVAARLRDLTVRAGRSPAEEKPSP